MELRGKTVLVTGASRGIGQATARALANAGSRLLLTGLELDELVSLQRELASRGVEASILAADLLDSAGRDAVLDWLRSQPPLDILVNNAGVGHFGPFLTTAWPDIERVVHLDAIAPTWLIHEVLPSLAERPEAAIVNVSSASARIPYPGLAAYAASKAYLSSLSQSLATELYGTSVRVMCIHPGFTQTSFFAAARMDMRRVPRWAISSPDRIGRRIVRMLQKDEPWGYTDPVTPAELGLAAAIPHRLRPRVFRRLFWDLPHSDRAESHLAQTGRRKE